jgi:hypothetical protein
MGLIRENGEGMEGGGITEKMKGSSWFIGDLGELQCILSRKDLAKFGASKPLGMSSWNSVGPSPFPRNATPPDGRQPARRGPVGEGPCGTRPEWVT